MHDIDRSQTEFTAEPEALEPEADQFEADQFETDQFESADFEFDQELDSSEFESPFSEVEEMELADEALSISSDSELDQFIGKAAKRAWRRVGRVARVVGRVARPMGGMLRGIAKRLLPYAAGAVGTYFGGPLGGAMAAKLGALASSKLEMEMEGMDMEDQEFAKARRFVRIVGSAAQQVAQANPAINPQTLAKKAVIAAMKQHIPGLSAVPPPPVGRPSLGRGARRDYSFRGRSGRWLRRGNKIVLLGV